jgi:hypothetical protein
LLLCFTIRVNLMRKLSCGCGLGLNSVCECAISKFYIIAKMFEYGTLEKQRSSVCNTGIGYENTKYFCRPVSFVCLFAISRTGFVHVSINCCGCSSPKPDCPLTLPSPPLAFGTVFFKPLSVNCNVYSPSGNMEVRFPELHIEVCPQDLDLDTATSRIERSAM